MAFVSSRRRGYLYKDTLKAGRIIKGADFDVTGKDEREHEILLSQLLKANQKKLNNKIIAQHYNDGQVASSYFFGKKHRPDMSLSEYGTAIEVKFINKNLNGIKDAIGQGLIYRLKYKFAILVLIVAKTHKELYEEAYIKHEPDLDSLLKNISDEMNIFTIIKPGFKPREGLGFSISYFP